VTDIVAVGAAAAAAACTLFTCLLFSVGMTT
jgi:hypothetical protein